MKKALIIFVRHPEPGKVKTRIAQTMGNAEALAIYCQLLEHTHSITQNLVCDKYVYYANTLPANDLWEETVYHKKIQKEASLGERMLDAFTELFALGYDTVQIIGSDCMELTSAIIEKGFSELATNDIVIGPSKDGGYYLLGMHSLITDLFMEKEWSTSIVFYDTMKDIQRLSLSCFTLPELSDIDTAADWLLYQSILEAKKSFNQ